MMSEDSARERLRKRVRRLEVLVLVLAMALVGAIVWGLIRTPAHDDVLTAERLEIVEPNGQPAFILANSQRPAAGTFDGQVLMADQAENRSMPTFIFYDGMGDEVGGMAFQNRETSGGFYASRYLALDGYEQDQTVQLFHRQNPEGASSGLAVIDRPMDRSLPETFARLGLKAGFTRAEADSAIAAAFSELSEDMRADTLRTLFGVDRLFLGSSAEDEAVLVLKDGDGRPRFSWVCPSVATPIYGSWTRRARLWQNCRKLGAGDPLVRSFRDRT